MSVAAQLAALFGTPSAPLAPPQAPHTPLPELPTDEELEAYSAHELPTLGAVQAEKARRHLRHFVRYAWSVLDPAELSWSWHMDVLCDYAQELIESWAEKRPSRNGVINIPPGCSKSRIFSVMAPAWAWIKRPHMTMRCMSANPRAVHRDAVLMRELVTSSWYRESFRVNWGIDRTFDSKGLFKNTVGGARYSQGMNAAATGERTDIQIIDDPHDAKDALSETKRKSVTERYTTSIWNRMNDARIGVRMLIMQRLHEAELAGVLIKQGWETLCLPMKYDPEHPHVDARDPRTVKGEVLDPVRFTPKVLADDEKTLGPFGVAGQHQQRPSPEDGGMFKRGYWRWYRPDGAHTPRFQRPPHTSDGEAVVAPKFVQTLISVDAAFTKTDTSDFVGIVVMSRALDTRRFVRKVINQRMDFMETCATIKALALEFPEALWKIIEKKANGDAIINMLTAEISGLIPINPEGGKVSRAFACSPAVASGEVYLLEGAEWVAEFIDQHASFPNGAHDDMVDAFTQAMNYLGLDADVIAAMMLCTA